MEKKFSLKTNSKRNLQSDKQLIFYFSNKSNFYTSGNLKKISN